MKIDKQQLLFIMPRALTRVNTYLPLLNRYFEEFEINTALRVAHFLAQIAVESGELRYTEEIASGSMYEGRKDLGNIAQGDGIRFKGRGLIQLTGRRNYQRYMDFCGFDVVSKPELLAQPLGATRSAAWYWRENGLNELADKDDITVITKKINGGLSAFSTRKMYLERAKKALFV